MNAYRLHKNIIQNIQNERHSDIHFTGDHNLDHTHQQS